MVAAPVGPSPVTHSSEERMSEERFITVGGNKLRVLIEGRKDGPWLTMLHGAATNVHLWDPQIKTLASRFRILRIEVRGHGKSTADVEAKTFDDLVADVIAVWDALGIEKSTVMGLSLGGMTGFGLAIAHPDRVERLIAADCRSDAPEAFSQSWVNRLQVLKDKGVEGIAEITIPMWMTKASQEGRPDVIAGARDMIMSTTDAGYVSVATPLMILDYKKDLGKIRCPTLLIVGSEDGPHPEEMRKMADLIPGAKYAVVEGAGHISNFEQPERFNTALLDYLKNN
jgi:3-oxoadipate enol-lactonase